MPRLNNETCIQACGTMQAGGNKQGLTVYTCTIGRLLRWFQQTASIIDRPISNQPFTKALRQQACIRQRHVRERFTTVVTTARQTIGRHGRSIHPRSC
jgi:hypothetical protein